MSGNSAWHVRMWAQPSAVDVSGTAALSELESETAAPTYTVTIANSALGSAGNLDFAGSTVLWNGQHYKAIARTYIYVSTAFTVSGTVRADDYGALYINGARVAFATSSIDVSSNTRYSHTFAVGVHKLDAVLHEVTSADFFRVGWNPAHYTQVTTISSSVITGDSAPGDGLWSVRQFAYTPTTMPPATEAGSWPATFAEVVAEPTATASIASARLDGAGTLQTDRTATTYWPTTAHYKCLCTLHAHVSEPLTIRGVFTSEGTAALWLNGARVVSSGSTGTSTPKVYTIAFSAGAHKIDVVHSRSGGGAYVCLGWSPAQYAQFGVLNTLPSAWDNSWSVRMWAQAAAPNVTGASALSALFDAEAAPPTHTRTVPHRVLLTNSRHDYGSASYYWFQDNYKSVATTYVYVSSAFSVSGSVNTDDNGAFYVNGARVAFTSAFGDTSANRSFTHAFAVGVHKLDFVLLEVGGNDFMQLGWNPSNHAQVTTISSHPVADNANAPGNGMWQVRRYSGVAVPLAAWVTSAALTEDYTPPTQVATVRSSALGSMGRFSLSGERYYWPETSMYKTIATTWVFVRAASLAVSATFGADDNGALWVDGARIATISGSTKTQAYSHSLKYGWHRIDVLHAKTDSALQTTYATLGWVPSTHSSVGAVSSVAPAVALPRPITSTRTNFWLARMWNNHSGSAGTSTALANLFANEARPPTYLRYMDLISTSGFYNFSFEGYNGAPVWPNTNSYKAIFTTHMYFATPLALRQVRLQADDSAALFIDGVFIVGQPFYSGVGSLYSTTISAGWHKVDVTMQEGSGGDQATIGWSPLHFPTVITDVVAPYTNTLAAGTVTLSSVQTTTPPQEGQTLTGSVSGASDYDGVGALAYQWFAGTSSVLGSAIAGATGLSLVLSGAQVGSYVRLQVSFTDPFGGVEKLTSAPAGPVGAPNAAPAGSVRVSGKPRLGQLLSVDTSTLSDADGLGTLAFEWQSSTTSDGTFLPFSSASTCTPTSAELGRYLRVRVTYTDARGTPESVVSAAVGPVIVANSSPTGTVIVQGTPRVGLLLEVDASTLVDADGLGTFSYEWHAADTADGPFAKLLTTANLIVPGTAEGKFLRVLVTYVDGLGAQETFASAAVGPVAPGNVAPEGVVEIRGAVRVGEQLTADATGVSDADGMGELSYMWQLADSELGPFTGVGADADFIVPVSAEGMFVRVTCSFVDLKATAESVTSRVVGPVERPNSVPTGSVMVRGSTRWGDTLTADVSTLRDADGLGALGFTWQQASSSAGPFTAAGNGAAKFVPVVPGQFVRVVVTYTDGRGAAEQVTSAAVGPIVAQQTPLGWNSFVLRNRALVDVARGAAVAPESVRAFFSTSGWAFRQSDGGVTRPAKDLSKSITKGWAGMGAMDDDFIGDGPVDGTGARFVGAQAWRWAWGLAADTAVQTKGRLLVSLSRHPEPARLRVLLQDLPSPSGGSWRLSARMLARPSTLPSTSFCGVAVIGSADAILVGRACSGSGYTRCVLSVPFAADGTACSELYTSAPDDEGADEDVTLVEFDAASHALRWLRSASGVDGSFQLEHAVTLPFQPSAVGLGVMTRGAPQTEQLQYLSAAWFQVVITTSRSLA